TFPVESEKLKIALDSAAAVDMKTNIMFIIQSETDFEKAQALISKFQIEQPSFIPLYNGNNLCLFEDNIYIDKNDLEANKILLKDIYARGAINPMNFGRLFIFPDSRVYSNVNASCLGILGKHTIYEIIFREMNNGKSWRRIRKHVMPCKKCVFERLCPPISNYNYAIKKYNLCHIWKERSIRGEENA
ncbi:MAG: hypothetical protein GTN82_35945, partial [Candidatus Aminicenantes bacterium]|nr:hypothetical protein [Candidatus Aminicenantes bacterium]